MEMRNRESAKKGSGGPTPAARLVQRIWPKFREIVGIVAPIVIFTKIYLTGALTSLVIYLISAPRAHCRTRNPKFPTRPKP